MAGYRWQLREPSGQRYCALAKPLDPILPRVLSGSNLLPGWLALSMLAIWSVAGHWFFPQLIPGNLTLSGWLHADYSPLLTTVWLASASVLLALPICLLWLEWGPKLNYWVYFPLILPALPMAVAQYQVLLWLKLDNTASGVVWSHLAWVVPYMTLVLAGPYRAFDARYVLTAQTLGRSRSAACLTIKWPMLLKPIMAALAVGFAVSITQYLPTLFAGGGRFATVTTEAVALSAGGNRRTLAIQAFLQVMLPMLGFMASSLVTRHYLRHRKGLH